MRAFIWLNWPANIRAKPAHIYFLIGHRSTPSFNFDNLRIRLILSWLLPRVWPLERLSIQPPNDLDPIGEQRSRNLALRLVLGAGNPGDLSRKRFVKPNVEHFPEVPLPCHTPIIAQEQRFVKCVLPGWST
jgi:hypothetical protein